MKGRMDHCRGDRLLTDRSRVEVDRGRELLRFEGGIALFFQLQGETLRSRKLRGRSWAAYRKFKDVCESCVDITHTSLGPEVHGSLHFLSVQ